MAGVNKVILIGNLGNDPEVRHLDNGRSVASVSIATSETYKDKQGNKQTSTEWVNLVFWSPLAEIVEKYLKKGSQIFVEGKLTTRSWEDKEGNKRYKTEVVCRDLTMLGGNPKENNDHGGGNLQENPSLKETVGAGDVTEADDLPF